MIAPSTIIDRLIGLVSLACLMFASGSKGVQAAANTDQGDSSNSYKACTPEEANLVFPGLTAAISARKGVIEMVWPSAEFHDPTDNFAHEECHDIVHEVFIVEGIVNFTELLLDDLRANESVHNHETTDLIHTAENLKHGVNHSALVIAKVGDDWVSSNRESRTLKVSTADPVLNQHNVTYLEEDTEFVRHVKHSDGVSMIFPASQSGNFEEGDWITGQDMNGEPYIVKLLSSTKPESTSGDSSKGIVVWKVMDGTLADIYERLDMSASVKVPENPGDTDSLGGSGGVLQSRMDHMAAAQHGFHFDKSKSIGPVDIAYSGDVGLWLDYNVDMGILPVHLDAWASVEAVLEQTASLTIQQTLAKNFNRTISLHDWQGTWVTFFVGGAPVSVKVTPITKVIVNATATLEGAFGVSASSQDMYRWEAQYELKKGWSSKMISSKPERDFDYNISASASLDLYGGLQLGVDLKVYGLLQMSPFIEAGPDLSIGAASTPKALLSLSENNSSIKQLFHFTKFNAGVKYAIGVTVGIDATLKILGKTVIGFNPHRTFKRQRRKTLFELPTAKLMITEYQSCAGDDAIRLTAEMHGHDYDGWLSNTLESEYDSAIAPSDHWTVKKEGNDPATVSLALKRSAIEDVGFFRLPEDGEVLYFATGATIPPLPFSYLLFEHDLESIEGMPDMKKFDCCDDSDCANKRDKIAGSPDRPVCRDYKCTNIEVDSNSSSEL